MNKEQQELYDKLLKKVNEYCLGAAAEDVIAAIDALVDTYETPKVDSASEALQALESIKKKQCIHILALKRSANWRAYNEFILPLNRYNGITLFDKLTQKEYKILKGILK